MHSAFSLLTLGFLLATPHLTNAAVVQHPVSSSSERKTTTKHSKATESSTLSATSSSSSSPKAPSYLTISTSKHVGTTTSSHVATSTVGSSGASSSQTVQPLGGSNARSYHSPAWLPFGQDLSPRLSQQRTNGGGQLGLLSAPKLPPFITGGPEPNGFPWGPRTAKNTNYYNNVPDTGVTRYYDLTVTNMTIAPDGVEVQGLVVNGQVRAESRYTNMTCPVLIMDSFPVLQSRRTGVIGSKLLSITN